MSSENIEVIPDRNICQNLCENFAEITGTDEACAQFYLQDRNWDLERSVNAFFEAKSSGGINILEDGDEPTVVLNVDSKVRKLLEMATEKPPEEFSLITWNIDGLDEKNLKKRTKAVLKNIEKYEPDVIFLQELIPETYSYLEAHLPHFVAIPSASHGYFNATFLRRTTIYFDSHKLIPYEETTMGRNLLFIEAHIGKTKLNLLNTHLESTAPFQNIRIAQLKHCVKLMKSSEKDVNNILGGDMNLRDKEATLSRISSEVKDIWEMCGSRPECQYTWDLKRNTNKQMPSKFQPRCRFDRVYLSASKNQSNTIKPIFFGLIGLEKVTNTQSFPSDHWGILINFKIIQSDAGNSSSQSANGNTNSKSTKTPVVTLDDSSSD